MNKEQVYVPLLTPEDCKRAYEILSKAGERVEYEHIKDIDKNYYFLALDFEKEWGLFSERDIKGLTQITLSQLSEMLMGKGETTADIKAEDYAIKKYTEKIKTYAKGSSLNAVYENCKSDYVAGYNAMAELAKLNEELYRETCSRSDLQTKELAQQTLELRKELDNRERFKMPTDKNVIDIAVLFNEGKLDKEKLADMVGMCQFILDRLYENGDITKPSSKE